MSDASCSQMVPGWATVSSKWLVSEGMSSPVVRVYSYFFQGPLTLTRAWAMTAPVLSLIMRAVTGPTPASSTLA